MRVFPFAVASYSLPLLICGIAMPLVAVAADDTVTTLDDVVVTADRQARTVDNTLAAVSILTRADLVKSQATTLPEALQQLPGISISNNGGLGKSTSIFLRGTNSSHVLVLVDGVKIGSATLGTVALQDIPLTQVERIEVVRGPRSSLYGSEAIGGVIQIFTRKGGEGFKPSVSLSVGSHNTTQVEANLSGGNKTSWYNLNAGQVKTDGFDATSSGTEPDDDGYERQHVSLKAGHRFANGLRTELSALQATGENDFDGSFNNSSEFTQQALSAKLSYDLNEHVALNAQVGQSRDESQNFLNGEALTSFSTYNTKRTSASVQADIALREEDNLIVGVDFQQDEVDSDVDYAEKSRDNTAVFAAYRTAMAGNDIDVSLRHDDNEQFGTHDTGAIAVGRDLNNGMWVTASYGTAFKAPTFNNLYFPFSGDPNLEPETSQNLEVGVSGKAAQGQLTWSATAFNNDIEKLISYPPPDFAVSQTDKARIQGLELTAQTQVAGWQVQANATVQKPENRSGANKGKTLILRPEQQLNIGVERDFGRISVGADVHAEGKRYRDAANTEAGKLAGFGSLDLRASYELNKDWTIAGKVGNVLDQSYETNQGYNQGGVNGMVTLNYAP